MRSLLFKKNFTPFGNIGFLFYYLDSGRKVERLLKATV
jgi:hypothetical protein